MYSIFAHPCPNQKVAHNIPSFMQCYTVLQVSSIIYYCIMHFDFVSCTFFTTPGTIRYPINAVNILKAHGQGIHQTKLIKGYGLNLARASQGMPKSISNAKVACLDINLHKVKMALGISVRDWLNR